MALYKKNALYFSADKKDAFDPQPLERHFKGYACFLCGTGPSLKGVDGDLLKKIGHPIIGLNNSFTEVVPDIWMGIDDLNAFDSSLLSFPFMKIYPWEKRFNIYNGVRLCDYANMYFFMREADDDRPSEHGLFLFEGNTFSSMIHMLRWLGFTRVYLLGCDFGGSNEISKRGSLYKKKKYNSKKQKSHLFGAIDLLKAASKPMQWPISRFQGETTEYISCTPNSPINEFLKYKDIKDLVY